MIYDIAGIGIGPFNLSLAALLAPIEQVTSLFFDKNDCFAWHPGMLIPGTTLQVPFYADLVTLADPTSKFNFFSFLKSRNSIIRFGNYDNNYITRKTFNDYCNWAVKQLDNLHFGKKVTALNYNQKKRCYEIITNNNSGHPCYAKHIVCGVGSVPYVPDFAIARLNDDIFHSENYLYRKSTVRQKSNITLIGSGQSAAEIFYDLLCNLQTAQEICWMTRSPRFFPMDFTKLSLEMTSPDYISYFYHLPSHKKQIILNGQDALYKGINASLINRIYEKMYELSDEMEHVPVRLMANIALQDIAAKGNRYNLSFFQTEQEKHYQQITDAVILATGYKLASFDFLQPVKERIRWRNENDFDIGLNYSIDKNRSEIFVQNAELCTHGFNAPDLGMGPHRNSIIINTILGEEYYVTEKDVTFQEFGI